MTDADDARSRRMGAGAILLAFMLLVSHLLFRGGDYRPPPPSIDDLTLPPEDFVAAVPAAAHRGIGRSTTPAAAHGLGRQPTTTPQAHQTVGLPPPFGDAVRRREGYRAAWRAATPGFDAAAAAHARRCEGRTGPAARPAVDDASQTATAVKLLAPAGGSVALAEPGWVRLLLEAQVGGRVACRGGDVLDVSMESADAKVQVDGIVDLGDGLYEADVFVRRGGAYRVCRDAVVSHAGSSKHRGCATMTRARIEALPEERLACDPKPAEVKDGAFCNLKGSWAGAACEALEVAIPAAAVARLDAEATASRRRGRCVHPDTYRSGEWRRVSACDGDVCTGNVSVLESDGWVWASDHCTLRLFDRAGAWRDAVGGRWIVAWGDSTLKQPVANMIEYGLGSSVFELTMEQLAANGTVTPKAFYHYRQYQLSRAPPAGLFPELKREQRSALAMTLSYAWGGCPMTMISQCGEHTTVRNRRQLLRYLDSGNVKRTAGPTDEDSVPSAAGRHVPDVVLLQHYHWRMPRFNETTLEAVFRDGLLFLHAALRERQGDSGRPFPVLVWMTGTRRVHGEQMRASRCATEDTESWDRHQTWQIEHMLSTEFPFTTDPAQRAARPSVLILSRHELTVPFHYGDTHGHFGVHYGATRGMCLTGLSHKQGYEVSRCLRKTFVDGMLIQWWFNILANHERRTAPPTA